MNAAELNKRFEMRIALIAAMAENRVIGRGGAIGLEVAEGLVETWNLQVSVVERLGHLLPQQFDATIDRQVFELGLRRASAPSSARTAPA